MLPTCKKRSGSQKTIEPDRRQRANDRRDGVEVGDLAVRIEERNEQKSRKTPGNSPDHDLECDKDGPTRAAMRVGQMPLATGTRGHRLRKGEAGATIPQRFQTVEDLHLPYD